MLSLTCTHHLYVNALASRMRGIVDRGSHDVRFVPCAGKQEAPATLVTAILYIVRNCRLLFQRVLSCEHSIAWYIHSWRAAVDVDIDTVVAEAWSLILSQQGALKSYPR